MLNNVETLKEKLDRVYERLRMDDLADQVLVPEGKGHPSTHLFSIKVASAQGLTPIIGDRLSPYVVLSDQHGNRIAKTRTLHGAESFRCRTVMNSAR